MRRLFLGALLLFASVAPARADRSPTANDALAAARTLSGKGSPQDAARQLMAWLAKPPPSTPALDLATVGLELARALLAAGDPAGARRTLDQIERNTRSITQGPMAVATTRRESARIAEAMGDYGRAEALLTAASRDFLAIAPGYAAEAENALGSVDLELSRPDSAVLAFDRAVSLLDRLDVPAPKLVPALVNLTKAALSAGDIDRGAAAAARALRVAGGDSRLVRAAKLVQAEVFLRQVDLPRAEAALDGVSDPSTTVRDDIAGQALFTKASALYQRGRLTEADVAAEAALDVLASFYRPDHPAVARTLHLLGLIQDLLGDTDTALAFFARSEAIERRTFGSRSRSLGSTLVDRARVELDAGQVVRAESTARAALSILESAPERTPRGEGLAHVVRAVALWNRRDFPAAEQQFLLGEDLIVRGFGANAPELGYLLIQYGRMLTDMARDREAGDVLSRALRLYASNGGAVRMRTAEAQGALATLYDRAGNRTEALVHSRKASDIVEDLQRSGAELTSTDGELQQRSARQVLLDHATLLLADPAADPALLDEAFRASQRAQQSRASEAIRLASLRLGEKHDGLAILLRQRSDDADALRQAEFLLRGQLAQAGAAAEREQARLRDIGRQRRTAIGELDDRIQRDYPHYTQFASAEPVSLASVQQALKPHELVLMPLVGTNRTLLWAVTSQAARALPVAMPRAEIRALIARIRRGLTVTPNDAASASTPFDGQASVELYRQLVTPIADLIGDHTTIIYIPDDVLQPLPLQILSDADGDWLVRRAAIEVMPSVAGLLSLRETPPAPSTPRSFLGVGDPLEREVDPASQNDQPSKALSAALQALPRLPETSDELRLMSQSYLRPGSQLLLGENATIENLLAQDLASFGVLAFASHAVMAGELPGLMEPAIVLSSSQGGNPADGLLKASQVASLNLHADLVILSACNTDAPDNGPFADGFSGLARAFLYAGTRSLLVSHWGIGSVVTVPLTTGFVANLSADPAIGKAEALRRSMLAMIDSEDPTLRHPSSWAAFSLVGE